MTDLPPPPVDPWSKQTKDHWFFGTLVVSTAALVYLLWPFSTMLLFAAVFVVVTWPMFERVNRWVGGRRVLAAALTLGAMGILVFGPVGYLLFLFAREAVGVARTGIAFVQSGELVAWVKWAVELPAHAEQHLPAWLPAPVRDFVLDALVRAPKEVDVVDAVAGPLQSGALTTLNAAGSAVPALIGATIDASIDASIFVFAAFALYIDGPRVLRVIKNLVPLDDAYEDRLFAVFAEISNNLVIGTLMTAVAMAVASFLGYAIAGVERSLFFAILTGIGSFVPVVGTGAVWIPLCGSVWLAHGPGWALFLAGYSLVVTSNVDTFLRPLFMRGSTNIHPLLIFLAVFGGMGWMGIPGALVGPVIVAFFLALYTIYVQNYLGEPIPPPEAAGPSLSDTLHAARERVMAAVGRGEPTVRLPEPPPPNPPPEPPPSDPTAGS